MENFILFINKTSIDKQKNQYHQLFKSAPLAAPL